MSIFLRSFSAVYNFFFGWGVYCDLLNPIPGKILSSFKKIFFFRKPYTPDVFNDLAPYYNTYIVNYMIDDQVGK